jgi:hypothetical protein
MKVLSKAFVTRSNVFLNLKQEIETLKLCHGHPCVRVCGAAHSFLLFWMDGPHVRSRWWW